MKFSDRLSVFYPLALVLVGAAAPVVMMPADPAIAQSDSLQSLLQTAQGHYANGDFMSARSVAQNIRISYPNQYEGYYFEAAAALALGDTIGARAMVAQAKTHVTSDYAVMQQGLERSLAATISAKSLLTQGETAEARGETYAAATSFGSAFDLQPGWYAQGLRAARLWARADNMAQAVKYYRRLQQSPLADIAQEAEKFLKVNAAGLNDLFKTNTTAGWTQLMDGNAQAAQESFEIAIDANPSFPAFKETYLHFGDSPYLGLATVQARANEIAGVEATLRRAARNGMRPDGSETLRSESAPLTVAMCETSIQNALQAIHGPAAARWASKQCEVARASQRATQAKSAAEAAASRAAATDMTAWNEAVAQFNAAIAHKREGSFGMASGEFNTARFAFEALSSSPTRGAESRTVARRAECNKLWVDARERLSAALSNIDSARVAVDASNSCLDHDFSSAEMSTALTEAQQRVDQSNRLTVTMCNQTSDKVQFVIISRLQKHPGKWIQQGWYTAAMGQCASMTAAYDAGSDSTKVYIAAQTVDDGALFYSKKKWFAADNDHPSYCTSQKVMERVVESGSCERDDNTFNYVVLIVKKDARNNGTRFTLR